MAINLANVIWDDEIDDTITDRGDIASPPDIQSQDYEMGIENNIVWDDQIDEDVVRMASPQYQALPDRPGWSGFLKDLGAGLLAGTKDYGEMVARAIRAFDPPGGIDVVRNFVEPVIKESKYLEGDPILQASKEAQSGVRKQLYGGLRALPPSAGGLVAAGAGGGLGALGIIGFFGAQEFDRYIEEATEQGKTYSESLPYAIASGLVEGGFESLADVLGAKIFGLSSPIKIGALSQPLKNALKITFGKTIARTLKQYPIEAGTESFQDVSEALLRKLQGIEAPDDLLKSAIEPWGPTLVLTTIFGLGAHGMNKGYLKQVHRGLTDINAEPKERVAVARAISQALKDKGNKADAELWDSMMVKKITTGEPINIDLSVAETLKKEGLTKANATGLSESAQRKLKNSMRADFQSGELSLEDITGFKKEQPWLSDFINELIAQKQADTEPIDLLEQVEEAPTELIDLTERVIEPPRAALPIGPEAWGQAGEQALGQLEAEDIGRARAEEIIAQRRPAIPEEPIVPS
ncbi:MAG: hypothetical protein KJ888_20210, partial [Gammaproteobacteria bacterium]|nr:hypothetical protein [Gammaproteobacteria bacterium]